MRLAIVGTGYVADFYVKTLPNHPELELVGVFDRDRPRMDRFAKFHTQVEKGELHKYDSLAALLADPRVELVLNLTNPSSHYEVSKAALEAGKHVYSEKPLSMAYAEAESLVALAKTKGLEIGGAPCSLLGETAQTLWKALRDNKIGPVRLVYAE